MKRLILTAFIPILLVPAAAVRWTTTALRMERVGLVRAGRIPAEAKANRELFATS